MKKTYADQCLERAENATEGPWEIFKIGVRHGVDTIEDVSIVSEDSGVDLNTCKFIAKSRTDVPELARRLNHACEIFRLFGFYDAANELEAPLGAPRCKHDVHGTDCFECYPLEDK